MKYSCDHFFLCMIWISWMWNFFNIWKKSSEVSWTVHTTHFYFLFKYLFISLKSPYDVSEGVSLVVIYVWMIIFHPHTWDELLVNAGLLETNLWDSSHVFQDVSERKCRALKVSHCFDSIMKSELGVDPHRKHVSLIWRNALFNISLCVCVCSLCRSVWWRWRSSPSGSS